MSLWGGVRGSCILTRWPSVSFSASRPVRLCPLEICSTALNTGGTQEGGSLSDEEPRPKWTLPAHKNLGWEGRRGLEIEARPCCVLKGVRRGSGRNQVVLVPLGRYGKPRGERVK